MTLYRQQLPSFGGVPEGRGGYYGTLIQYVNVSVIFAVKRNKLLDTLRTRIAVYLEPFLGPLFMSFLLCRKDKIVSD